MVLSFCIQVVVHRLLGKLVVVSWVCLQTVLESVGFRLCNSSSHRLLHRFYIVANICHMMLRLPFRRYFVCLSQFFHNEI